MGDYLTIKSYNIMKTVEKGFIVLTLTNEDARMLFEVSRIKHAHRRRKEGVEVDTVVYTKDGYHFVKETPDEIYDIINCKNV